MGFPVNIPPKPAITSPAPKNTEMPLLIVTDPSEGDQGQETSPDIQKILGEVLSAISEQQLEINGGKPFEGISTANGIVSVHSLKPSPMLATVIRAYPNMNPNDIAKILQAYNGDLVNPVSYNPELAKTVVEADRVGVYGAIVIGDEVYVINALPNNGDFQLIPASQLYITDRKLQKIIDKLQSSIQETAPEGMSYEMKGIPIRGCGNTYTITFGKRGLPPKLTYAIGPNNFDPTSFEGRLVYNGTFYYVVQVHITPDGNPKMQKTVFVVVPVQGDPHRTLKERIEEGRLYLSRNQKAGICGDQQMKSLFDYMRRYGIGY